MLKHVCVFVFESLKRRAPPPCIQHPRWTRSARRWRTPAMACAKMETQCAYSVCRLRLTGGYHATFEHPKPRGKPEQVPGNWEESDIVGKRAGRAADSSRASHAARRSHRGCWAAGSHKSEPRAWEKHARFRVSSSDSSVLWLIPAWSHISGVV